MSYEPPYRTQDGYARQPWPREQQAWPQEQQAWPQDQYQDRSGQADAFDGFDGYRQPSYQDGYQQPGYQEQVWPGYADAPAFDDRPRYTEQGYTEQVGFGGGRHQAARPRAALGRGRGPGVIVGAVMGFLAAAVAIGVATLAAAFFRPQASPIIAVGEAFIDRTPPALKNFAVEKFGENDKTMLLLGMYVTIALLAMAIGVLARKLTMIGVIGVAVFGLFGAFVAYTRPASKPSDIIPSIIGGIAGVLALLWLADAAKPEVELAQL
jgi:hypothetical protein